MEEKFVIFDEDACQALLVEPNPEYVEYLRVKEAARLALPQNPEPEDKFELQGFKFQWLEMITGDVKSTYSKYTGWSSNAGTVESEYMWLAMGCPPQPNKQIITPISVERADELGWGSIIPQWFRE